MRPPIFSLFAAPGSVPVVKVGPASLKVIEGEEAVFNCIASGEPEPNIRWSRLRGSFPESSVAVKGVLRIYPAVLGDGGTYICTAANRFGAVATSVTLEVEKGKDLTPVIGVVHVDSASEWENLYLMVKQPGQFELFQVLAESSKV